MALVYRGLSGSQFVYWLEGAPIPQGVSNYTLVGEANTASGSVQIIIPSTGSAAITRISVAGYTSTTATSGAPQEVGGFYYVPSEHNNTDIRLRSILSTITESNAAYVKLFNSTIGEYVHIGGNSIFDLSTTSSVPQTITSVNLASATNFSISSSCTYIMHLYGNGAMPITLHYNTEIITQ